jgi:hypothetical protein
MYWKQEGLCPSQQKSKSSDWASFTDYKTCPIIRMPDADFLYRGRSTE